MCLSLYLVSWTSHPPPPPKTTKPKPTKQTTQATSYVKQYRGIEGAAAKASEHYGAMVAAEARLKEEVLARVQR